MHTNPKSSSARVSAHARAILTGTFTDARPAATPVSSLPAYNMPSCLPSAIRSQPATNGAAVTMKVNLRPILSISQPPRGLPNMAPMFSTDWTSPKEITKSDQFQISPAVSSEILHHKVWRTWLFIACSDERWLSAKIVNTSPVHFSLKGWENVLSELLSERVHTRLGDRNRDWTVGESNSGNALGKI